LRLVRIADTIALYATVVTEEGLASLNRITIRIVPPGPEVKPEWLNDVSVKASADIMFGDPWVAVGDEDVASDNSRPRQSESDSIDSERAVAPDENTEQRGEQ
ncbi:hypothetical protein FOZ63_004467, partial [Perkinsus olseni]